MAAYRSWRSVSLRGLGNVTYPLYICFLNYEIGLKLPTSSSIGPWFRTALEFRHILSWKGMLPESGPNELGRWVKCLYNPLKTVLVLYTSDAWFGIHIPLTTRASDALLLALYPLFFCALLCLGQSARKISLFANFPLHREEYKWRKQPTSCAGIELGDLLCRYVLNTLYIHTPNKSLSYFTEV